MKDICIAYQKDNKTLAKKLVSKLESDGISCSVSPRDYKQEVKESVTEAVENSKILLLIIDNSSAQSKEQMDALEVALENELDVIPFVVEKIESSLYSEHFFYAFSWVDAYEDSFDDAYEVLLDAYEELSGENAGSKKGKVSKKADKQKTDNKPIIYVLATIAAIVIGYYAFQFFTGSEETQILVGQWRLTDYQDNLKRSQQDSILFATQTIPTIKRNALLIFNDDNTFERRGFSPEPQIGKWRLNDEGTILFLDPHGSKAQTDQLNLEGLSENRFTIVVDEIMPDSTMAHTRLTFSK
jgi:hypothetical protein